MAEFLTRIGKAFPTAVGFAAILGIIALYAVPSDISDTTKLGICLIVFCLMVGRQLGKLGLENLSPRKPFFGSMPAPIDPQHAKPTPDLSNCRHGEPEFFRHFVYFGGILNQRLMGTQWRVQVRQETYTPVGSNVGLFLDVYSGPERAGHMWVSPQRWGLIYSATKPAIATQVRIFHARHFPEKELQAFFEQVFYLLCESEEEIASANRAVFSAKLSTVWQIGPTVVRKSDLDVNFASSAKGYLQYAKAAAKARSGRVPA